MTSEIAWLILGLIFVLLELVTQLTISAAVGIAGITVSLLIMIGGDAPFLLPIGSNITFRSNLLAQVIIWCVLSVLLSYLLPLFMPQQPTKIAKIAKVIEPIHGCSYEGRVLYQGTQWNAVCVVESSEIPVDAKVRVVGRYGNTLVVVPAANSGYDEYEPME